MKFTFSNKSEMSALILIMVVSGLVVLLVPKGIDAGTQTGPILMNLSITKSIGISLSNILARNITFTNASCAVAYGNSECPILTSVNGVGTSVWNNATYNNNGSATISTNYSISNSGNTFEDICAIAIGNLTCAPGQGCGSDMIIMKGNATWGNATTGTTPAFWGSNTYNEWTADYASANVSAGKLANGATIYLRFWLQAPTAIVPGNYNTTYRFCAVENGGACTC
jgi:hypothetical protein